MVEWSFPDVIFSKAEGLIAAPLTPVHDNGWVMLYVDQLGLYKFWFWLQQYIFICSDIFFTTALDTRMELLQRFAKSLGHFHSLVPRRICQCNLWPKFENFTFNSDCLFQGKYLSSVVEHWKQHFSASRFQDFLREACMLPPDPPSQSGPTFGSTFYHCWLLYFLSFLFQNIMTAL